AKPGGGRSVCSSSPQRGIGRLGGGAQECSVHVVLPACPRSVRLVCAEAGGAPLLVGCAAFCHGAGLEAHGNYSPACPPAGRFLAFAPYFRMDTPAGRVPGAADVVTATSAGEATLAGALGCERSCHHRRAAARRRLDIPFGLECRLADRKCD